MFFFTIADNFHIHDIASSSCKNIGLQRGWRQVSFSLKYFLKRLLNTNSGSYTHIRVKAFFLAFWLHKLIIITLNDRIYYHIISYIKSFKLMTGFRIIIQVIFLFVLKGLKWLLYRVSSSQPWGGGVILEK